MNISEMSEAIAKSSAMLPARAVDHQGHRPGEDSSAPALDTWTKDEAEPFSSKILPPTCGRLAASKSCCPGSTQGISTGDFNEALQALVGRVSGLSPRRDATLESWRTEYTVVETVLERKHYVYCGSTAFTSTSAWKKIGNASWSSWAPRRRQEGSSLRL